MIGEIENQPHDTFFFDQSNGSGPFVHKQFNPRFYTRI